MRYKKYYDIFLEAASKTDEDALSEMYNNMDDPYIIFQNAYHIKKGGEYIPISIVAASVSECAVFENKAVDFCDLKKCWPSVIEKGRDYSHRADACLIKEILNHKILDKKVSLSYELINIIPLNISKIDANMAIIEFVAG